MPRPATCTSRRCSLAQARRMLRDDAGPRPGDRVRRQLARLPPLRGAQQRRSRALPGVHERAAAGDVRGAGPLLRRRRCSTTARCSTSSYGRAHVRESGRWPSTMACRSPPMAPSEWVRVDDADAVRPRRPAADGGLPDARTRPGLRTSPVKRGYWVVRRLLGEHIPAAAADRAGAARTTRRSSAS